MKFKLYTALACLLLVTSFVQAADRPNFLLIISDDSTWSDFGFAGNTDVKTPNLDKLATEGMFLKGMFTPASTCSPSRHALYTGLYSMRSGAYPNHTQVYPGTKSLFTMLKRRGYRVALQGKEHVGPKASFPYEHFGAKGGPNEKKSGLDDFEPTREFLTRDENQPWLLVYASNDPHSPWNRGPDDLHDPAQLKVPAYLHDNEVTRKDLAKYYAEIHQFDWQVGQLMQLLKETSQENDTLVLFVSEQGSSFPYGGKWSMYDTGIRVSALARWPGHIKAGSTSEALVQYVDVAPTFLDAAGIDPNNIDVGCPDANGATGFDGKSMLGVLTGKDKTFREYVFSQHTTVGINGYEMPYPIRAVRDSRYKFIRNLAPDNTYSIGGIHKTPILKSWQDDAVNNPELAARIEWLFHRPGEELYDLEHDPLEEHNLASDPALADIKSRLATQLEGWMQQQGDKGMETELAAHERQPGRQKKQPRSGK
ncbi:MAG: sulfatase [Planctomycetaceae bacterium]